MPRWWEVRREARKMQRMRPEAAYKRLSELGWCQVCKGAGDTMGEDGEFERCQECDGTGEVNK